MSRTISQVDSRLTTEINTRAGQLAGTIQSVLGNTIKDQQKQIDDLKARVEFLELVVCPPKVTP